MDIAQEDKQIKREAWGLHTERAKIFRKIGRAKPLSNEEKETLAQFGNKYYSLEEKHVTLFGAFRFYYQLVRTGKSW